MSNFAGIDTIVKNDFIQIGSSAVTNLTIFDKIKLFPNPVPEEKINIEFELQNKDYLEVILYNEQGKFIRKIIDQKVKAGLNNLSFSTDMLISGLYYLNFKSKISGQTKTLSFQKL